MAMVVQCSNCGEAVSEWAARCPLCGANLDDAAPLPDSSPKPELLVEPSPASRRLSHRARWIAGVLSLMIIVVAAVVATASHPARPGRTPFPNSLSTYTLVIADR